MLAMTRGTMFGDGVASDFAAFFAATTNFIANTVPAAANNAVATATDAGIVNAALQNARDDIAAGATAVQAAGTAAATAFQEGASAEQAQAASDAVTAIADAHAAGATPAQAAAAAVAVVQAKPFYKQPLFWIAVASVAAVGTGGYVYYRRNARKGY